MIYSKASYIHPKQGILCGRCPLFEAGVVVGDYIPIDSYSGLAIIGEMPGKNEVRQGEVFVGESGRFLRLVQEKLGRAETFVTNAIRCGLKKGAKPTNAEMQLAAECCKPTVVNNLKWIEADAVICFGAWPMYHYMGVGNYSNRYGCTGIDTFRGTVEPPTENEPWYVTAANHPAGIFGYANQARHPLTEIFRDDFEKAFSLAEGRISVYEPDVRDAGNVGELIDWLADACEAAQRTGRPIACDVETDGKDALTCGLRTIGLSFDGVGWAIPYPGWYPAFYTAYEWSDIAEWLEYLLEDPAIDTVFHNKIFDVPILERVLDLEIGGRRHDTLLIHHAIYPLTPHGLQNVASQYLAVEPWKVDFKTFDWESDESEEEFQNLLWYNAQDAVCTEEIYHHMMREAREMGVIQVVDHDRVKADFSIDMYRTGIRLDVPLAKELAKKYELDIATRLGEIQQLVSEFVADPADIGLESFFGTTQKELKKKQGFNPRSTKQLRDLIYRFMGLTPTKLTATTLEPSTDKESLWDQKDNNPEFFNLLFDYKEKAQIYSLYLKDVETKKTRSGNPYLYADGRVHPIWKGQGTPTGRYATDPQVQNFSYDMLKMFIPRAGCVMIGADYSTLEVRVVAALAGQMDLVQFFNSGGDVHTRHASELYYPAAWAKAVEDGNEELLKKLRTAGKPVTFGKNYQAGWETIYNQIRMDRADEDQEDLKREVRIMTEAYDRQYTDIMRMAEVYHEFANTEHFLATGILRRMRKFPLGGAKPTDCASHPIQGTAAEIMDLGMLRYWSSLREADLYLNGVWPNLQVHDSLFCEAREDIAEQERQRLQDCLSCKMELVNPITGRGVFVDIPAEAKIGKNVAEVK